MLLGSPPDTVHGTPLRRTDPSSLLTQGGRHRESPGAGIHPCCSGLQAEGTANSPTSAALPHAESGAKTSVIVHQNRKGINKNMKKGLYNAEKSGIISRHGRSAVPIRACSAAGSAFGSHPRGRGFKSLQVHHVGASVISLAPTFFKSQSALILLRLLSEPDPLRRGPVWSWCRPESRSI